MERAPTIRPERTADHAAIRRVTELAFGGALEAGLVEALRDSAAYVPELSLVAEDGDGAIVGHVMLSAIELRDGPRLLSLAPLSVLPERQGEGIGAALTREAIARARRTSYPAIVLLGHPDYYPRFGFEPATPRNLTSRFAVTGPAWQMLPLPAYDPATVRGEVIYPPFYDGG